MNEAKITALSSRKAMVRIQELEQENKRSTDLIQFLESNVERLKYETGAQEKERCVETHVGKEDPDTVLFVSACADDRPERQPILAPCGTCKCACRGSSLCQGYARNKPGAQVGQHNTKGLLHESTTQKQWTTAIDKAAGTHVILEGLLAFWGGGVGPLLRYAVPLAHHLRLDANLPQPSDASSSQSWFPV